MKKLIVIFVFTITNMSFKSQANNREFVYLGGAVAGLVATIGSGVTTYAYSTVTGLFDGRISPKEIINEHKLIPIGVLTTIIFGYLTKKACDQAEIESKK